MTFATTFQPFDSIAIASMDIDLVNREGQHDTSRLVEEASQRLLDIEMDDRPSTLIEVVRKSHRTSQ